MTSFCLLFKVGLPDEKGEHCEVKKEEKIELSKSMYIDVLIQIQHHICTTQRECVIYYIQHTISQDARCGLGKGEGSSLVCLRNKWRNLQERKIKMTLGEIFVWIWHALFWISLRIKNQNNKPLMIKKTKRYKKQNTLYNLNQSTLIFIRERRGDWLKESQNASTYNKKKKRHRHW